MRRRICLLSAVMSLIGWGGAVLIWLMSGHGAGVRPDFILALCLGVTGVLVWTINVVMPDQAALYALGYRDGVQCGECSHEDEQPPVRHLSSV